MKNKILTKIGALVVGLTMAVGVGIAVSNNARLEAKADSATFDFTDISGFSSWGNSYSKHDVSYDQGTVTFASASKQTSTITDRPVTKGGNVIFVAKSGITLSGLTFTCKQWSAKGQTITLHSSTNGGDSYTSTGVTSTNFALTNNSLPEGTNAVKFTFSSTSNQVGITSLAITYTESSGKVDVTGVSLDQSELSIELGKTATLKATVTPGNATNKNVSWSSDDEDVATVEDGVVTAKAIGTATITVTTEDQGKTATCAVTVTEPAPKKTFNLVKDVADLADGDKVIIAAAEFDAAMSTVQNNNNRGQVSITKDEESILEVDNLQIFTLEATETENVYAFNTGDGYIYAASSGSNYLRTQTTNDANGEWKITITSAGVASMVAQGSNTRNTLKYNSTNNPPVFSAYASESTQKDIAIYKAAASDATVLEAAGYAKAFLGAMTCETVDGQSSVTAAEGAWADMKTAYEALSADAQKYLKKHDAADKDAAVPTGDVTKDNAEQYIGAALIRYEWIIHVYTEAAYENFMGRTINTTSGTNVEPVKFDNATKNNITLVIIILSVAAITALGAYLFIDKRRKVSK